MRHLVHQGFGETEMPAAPRGGVPSRQGNLACHAASAARGGHPGGRFGGSTRRVQGGRRPGLAGGRRGLEHFQLGDTLYQRRFVGCRIDGRQFLEHTFDSNCAH